MTAVNAIPAGAMDSVQKAGNWPVFYLDEIGKLSRYYTRH